MIVRLTRLTYTYLHNEIWAAPPNTILILLNARDPHWHSQLQYWSYLFISGGGIGYMFCSHLNDAEEIFEELTSS